MVIPNDEDDDYSYSDHDSLLGSSKTQGEAVKPWDTCQIIHRQNETGSTAESKWINTGTVILKFFTVIFVFLVVLCGAVTSKITLLLMTSQIKQNISRPYCQNAFDKNRQYIFSVPEVERITWIWLIIFAFFVPELGTFIRSMRRVIFKTWSFPQMKDFFILLLTETLPSIGSSILVFIILPELDVLRGAMLTNAMCLIPSLELLLRNIRRIKKSKVVLPLTLDILALVAQVSAFVVWPLVENNKPILWFIPVACALISFGWWENFINEKSPIIFLRRIAKSRKKFPNSKYFSYAIISPLKCLIFLCTTLLIFHFREGDATFIFNNFQNAFSDHQMTVNEVVPKVSGTDIDFNDAISTGVTRIISSRILYQIIIWLTNIIATYLCYIFGKFACKIMIQASGFAFPINLVVPVTITVLSAVCGDYVRDKCVYFKTFPEEITYLFFNIPPLLYLEDFIGHQHVYIWLAWLLSQFWITQHIWKNRNSKLAATEQLFMRPMYDAFLIDQSSAMNRRNVTDRFTKEKPSDHTIGPDISNKDEEDKITRIYACGTMWHETREEIMEFLKTIFRMDEDQAAHRIVRRFLDIPIDSYYEWETHIFFDDAYIRLNEYDNDPHLNQYVMILVDTIEEAATEVHKTKVRIQAPIIYATPYGGKLVWILPGKTKIVAHLKDPAKIRKKKRWSQVMYMYYLLGHKILDDETLTPARVQIRAKNTYILALDGDIDFQPEAVHLLVQYMKKKDNLGAACGRIHPIGSGAIAWYQVFEYAVGHWLQKATEHVLGCVLCSPGCFSLFRASALMDHNVMARYTTRSSEARHYVQYDQGEDRWLCTLLLQRGYRVEYSAASDAYTHCPEGFNEFYNQRRRWMPSTMANILDLLQDAKNVMKVNDDIAKHYIFYQFVLLIGTVIGPGTIFLMLQGAFVTAFGISQWTAFIYNAIPILAFVLICVFCKSDTQLKAAAIISGIYGLIMMTVIVGVLMQIEQDGILAPSSLFFLIMMGEYVVAALLHPKEFYCLKYGIIYLVTVPSMYLLLVIYSVFNMNNVTWGTRDIPVAKVTEDNQGKGNQPKNPEISPIVSMFYKLRDFFRGCCGDSKHLLMISNSLSNLEVKTEQINRKVDYLESITLDPEAATYKRSIINSRSTKKSINGVPRASRLSTKPKQSNVRPSGKFVNFENSFNEIDEEEEQMSYEEEESEELQGNSWFYDGKLINGHVTFLDKKEETFWEDLISKYLYPIQDDKEKVAQDLKNLRDQVVLTFFMINALYVLVVFLLTLQKDLLHVNWPFNPTVNFTYKALPTENEVEVNKTLLELQPVGFVFLIFFFALMFVQFICMFLHRFGTYSQIMANTELNISCCQPKIEDISEEELLEKDPIKVFKQIIKLKGVNGDTETDEQINAPVARRATVAAINQNKTKKLAIVNDLDSAFAIRWEKLRKNECPDVHLPRQTFAAIQRRRTTMMQRKSQMSNFGRSINNRISTDSGIPEPIRNRFNENTHSFDNPTFENIPESTS